MTIVGECNIILVYLQVVVPLKDRSVWGEKTAGNTVAKETVVRRTGNWNSQRLMP